MYKKWGGTILYEIIIVVIIITIIIFFFGGGGREILVLHISLNPIPKHTELTTMEVPHPARWVAG